MVSALGNVPDVGVAWVVELRFVDLQVSDLQATGDKALHFKLDIDGHLPEIHQLLLVDDAQKHQLGNHDVLFAALDLVELPSDVVVGGHVLQLALLVVELRGVDVCWDRYLHLDLVCADLVFEVGLYFHHDL